MTPTFVLLRPEMSATDTADVGLVELDSTVQ
jgi:hypothetical protein